MLHLSHAHLCSEHLAECDFVNFIGRNTKWGLLQSVTDLKKIPVQISKDEADEQQAHSMIPKIERYTDTLKQSTNKAKTKSLTRMPTAEKAVKERDCTQMPMAKKERTDHKCLWQRKKDQTTNAGGK